MSKADETTVDSKRACFQTSADTIIVAKRLLKLEPGEILTIEEANRLVPGRKLFGNSRHVLTSAIRYVLKNDGVVIASVRSVGVKRMQNDDIPSLGDAAIHHIRRTSKRTASKIVRGSNYDSMSNPSKQKFNQTLSVLGALRQFTAPKALTAVSDAVNKSGSRLALKDVVNLDQFKTE